MTAHPNFKRSFALELIERLRQCKSETTTAMNANSTRKFNMTNYDFACGSPACIAGHAVHISRGTLAKLSNGSIEEIASRLLGLETRSLFNDLFIPSFMELYKPPFPMKKITSEMAIDCLQHMIDDPEADDLEAWGYVHGKFAAGHYNAA